MGAEGTAGRQERALPGRTQPSQVQEVLLIRLSLSSCRIPRLRLYLKSTEHFDSVKKRFGDYKALQKKE